jgi:hypothetical protein
MTGYEEEALERFGVQANVARVSNEILARCSVDPGEDWANALAQVHQMTVLERDAALVELRILSLGDQVDQEVACPHCDTKNVASFRLSDLPLAQLGRAASPRGNDPGSATGSQRGDGAQRAELEIALPSGGTALARLPSAKDQEDLFDARLSSAAARKSFLIARVVTRLRSEAGPLSYEAAHALPSSDRDAIEQALNAAMVELDLSMAADCVSCGQRFEHAFDVARFFFRS